MYFCKLADGSVKHIHEQSDPHADKRAAVVQGCVGSHDIFEAYEIPAAQAEAELSKLVADKTTDQGTAEHIFNNFKKRHEADLIKNIVPLIEDIQNG